MSEEADMGMEWEWRNPSSLNAGGGRLSSVQSYSGLRIEVVEGDGSSEDPMRSVVHYFDEHGNHIAAVERGSA